MCVKWSKAEKTLYQRMRKNTILISPEGGENLTMTKKATQTKFYLCVQEQCKKQNRRD